MRHYVYALIDPTLNNVPFYVGKGLDNRLQCHFKAAEKSRSKTNEDVIGCDTRSLLDDAAAERVAARLARINSLIDQGFDHTQIARVVARRMDEATAFAVESFLIRSIYGIESLTNRVEGAHADRFRSSAESGFVEGFDIDADDPEGRLQDIETRFGRFYVYTLRDPGTGRVFYVGKGTGRRMFAHFSDASKVADNAAAPAHLRLLSTLVQAGFRTRELCRVEARLQFEQQAFAVEALLLKFIHGFDSVDNRVAGHHGEMFRAKGDWETRRGFDLPYICDPGARVDRADKRDGMIGEGLAVPLLAVAASFPELAFDPPTVLDASELGVEADIKPNDGGVGTRLKLFIRRSKLQLELRPRRKAQREWMKAHFSRLGAYPLRRRDDVFFPDQWRGPANMTDDLEVFAKRIRLMQEIVNAQTLKSLSDEARSLLPINGDAV